MLKLCKCIGARDPAKPLPLCTKHLFNEPPWQPHFTLLKYLFDVNIFFFSDIGLLYGFDDCFPSGLSRFPDIAFSNITNHSQGLGVCPYHLNWKSVLCRCVVLSQCLCSAVLVCESVSCKCHAVLIRYCFMVHFEVRRCSSFWQGMKFCCPDTFGFSR